MRVKSTRVLRKKVLFVPKDFLCVVPQKQYSLMCHCRTEHQNSIPRKLQLCELTKL